MMPPSNALVQPVSVGLASMEPAAAATSRIPRPQRSPVGQEAPRQARLVKAQAKRAAPTNPLLNLLTFANVGGAP